jgi:hypothetical protein
MMAAENIVKIVRNSSRDHIKYVNPFLTNTLWFAAASQIACKVVGPSSRAGALAGSNYDLLALTIERYISFWCSTGILKPKLERIETALSNLMVKDAQDAANDGSPGERDDATLVESNYVEAGQVPTQPHASSASLIQPGLNLSEGPVEADQLSFMAMFQAGNESNCPSQHVVLEDLEHFLPYGVDELWTLPRQMPIW